MIPERTQRMAEWLGLTPKLDETEECLQERMAHTLRVAPVTGSLGRIDALVTFAIIDAKSVAVSTEMVKVKLALYWLRAPSGFFSRLAWLWRLVRFGFHG